MKKLIYFFLPVVVVAIMACACKRNNQQNNINHLVVIGIDGMSVGGVIESSTPNFDKFMQEGAYNLHARNVMPTSSSPNWEAMLTGSGVAQTGVTSNDWRFDNYNLPPVVTTENGRYPDIFYAIKKGNPALKTASIYHWDGFANLYDHANVDLDFDCEDEKLTAAKVAEVLKSDKPDFVFVQLDHVDHAGHEYGHMTSKYFEAVELADQLAGQIVEATKEAGIFEETLFLIVADHGGKGFDHGHETIQGNEVPFILYGSGIKKGYHIPAAINLYDVAATSAFVLNVKAPQVWLGRAVECAFAGYPESDNIMGNFMAPSAYIPEITPKKVNGEVGGLFIGKEAIVNIKSAGTDGIIRYTIDGTIPTVKSNVYNGPFEMVHSGVVKAAFFGNDGSQSDFTKGFFRVVKDKQQSRLLRYSLYSGDNWKKLPDFSSLKYVSKGRTYEISLDEIEDEIDSNTGVVFEGFIHTEFAGDYSFYTVSDDGSQLFIDDNLVVDNDGDHGVQEKEGSIRLTKGKHKIKVAYFNGGGGFYLNCLYSGPNIPKQIISPDVFIPR